MAVALNVDIFDDDGVVLVRHVFFGHDEAEAEEYKQHHIQTCSYFRAADKKGRTGEFTEELDDDEIPSEEDYDEKGSDEGEEEG